MKEPRAINVPFGLRELFLRSFGKKNDFRDRRSLARLLFGEKTIFLQLEKIVSIFFQWQITNYNICNLLLFLRYVISRNEKYSFWQLALFFFWWKQHQPRTTFILKMFCVGGTSDRLNKTSCLWSIGQVISLGTLKTGFDCRLYCTGRGYDLKHCSVLYLYIFGYTVQC